MTQEQARRTILRQHGLIEPFDDPFDAVRAMVAVQTQYAFSLPVAVAVRTRQPRKGWDEKELVPGGALVKAWSVRHTLHTHLREDHALILSALGDRWYLRFSDWCAGEGYDVSGALERIMDALADGPLTRKELHERVPELKKLEWAGWGMDVKGLAFQQRLCIVGRGAEQKFAVHASGRIESSVAAVVRRYLGSYGPATTADFAHWAGISIKLVRETFAAVEGELVRVDVEGLAGPRYALSAPEVSEAKLGVRLLAKFDPLVLSHRDKSLFIDPAHLKQVFRKAAQVEAVVLSEGRAVGTWRVSRGPRASVFRVECFAPPGARVKGRIEKEAEKMAKRLHLAPAEVVYQDPSG